MQSLRKIISWCFAVESLLFLILLCRNLQPAYQLKGSMPHRLVPITILSLVAIAIIFAAAWWTVWKEKPSANGWGIAASFFYILIFLQLYVLPSLLFPRRNVLGHVGALFLGIAGVLIFFRREGTRIDSDASGAEKTHS
jgi:uncharacterized membrane protein YozB (DUF420 family)